MRFFSLFLFLGLLACGTPMTKPSTTENSQLPTYPDTGSIIVLDARLQEVLDTQAPIEILAEGYTWAEGPLWLEELQLLIWSDVPQNTIYSWKEDQKAAIYLQPSGYTDNPSRGGEPGSNGLLLDPAGRLVICQHGDRRVARMEAELNSPEPRFTTLAKQFEGKRFNSPNDAAFGPDGYLYFTDPPYGLERQENDAARELDFQGVFRLSPKGEVSLMTDELSRPNGIAFSPDLSKCYVANSDPDHPVWMVYELDQDHKFINGRVFFDASHLVETQAGLPDGLKVNRTGYLFATGPGGVLIISPEGDHLGTISTGQATANCAFNADESVLYMTAHRYLMRVSIGN